MPTRIYIDIAEVSLQQMQERYKTLRDRTFSAEFYPMDCYTVNIRTIVCLLCLTVFLGTD